MSQQSELLEQLAAAWLDARASGNVRAWRDASTKLDAALAAERATLKTGPTDETLDPR